MEEKDRRIVFKNKREVFITTKALTAINNWLDSYPNKKWISVENDKKILIINMKRVDYII